MIRRLLLLLLLVLMPQAVWAQQAFVTFSFDDAPKSVVTVGLPLMEKYHYPATLYISTRNTVYSGMMNWDDIALAARAGWEIGAHTHTHAKLTKMTDDAILEDLLTSTQWFAAHGYAPVDFATPYGAFDDRVLAILKRHYQSHRTSWPDGINTLAPDPYHLLTFDVVQSTTLGEIEAVFDELDVSGGWVILQMHYIFPKGAEVTEPYGTNLLNDIIEQVHQRGLVVLSVDDALKHFRAIAKGAG